MVTLLAGRASAAAPSAGAALAHLQQFFLTYSGVFALVTLTAAVAAGLIATDRLVVAPGGRVVFQAVHRALSLVAVGLLASHVMLEILAHRSRPIDAAVPFLASGRTIYLGLGTLASDLVLLIVFTGVARRKFAARWTAAWRAVHVTAYLAWPLAILHGLLGGRPARPYVDWSYGACVAAVALALIVRMVAATRSRAEIAAQPVPQAAPGSPAALPAARPPDRWLPVPPPHQALPPSHHAAAPHQAAAPYEDPPLYPAVRPNSPFPPPSQALPGEVDYDSCGIEDDARPRASGTP